MSKVKTKTKIRETKSVIITLKEGEAKMLKALLNITVAKVPGTEGTTFSGLAARHTGGSFDESDIESFSIRLWDQLNWEPS